ncbi:MAG: metallophosphoesterase family protein, partial [Deltaproteobacteria bacterium]|nr:metallophosphoesterase family protein [Deltaproteobacteria bacterium]
MTKQNRSTTEKKIGVISDTHGLLRPTVNDVFKGVDMIIHAGDIGTVALYRALEKIAPVTAVFGNMDNGPLINFLSETEFIRVNGFGIYVLHDIFMLDRDPAVEGIHLVISGHTHRPELTAGKGVQYLNPGSAGHRRFHLPISVAILTISESR